MHCVDRMKRSGRVYPPHDQTAELLAVTPLAGFQSKTGSAFTHSPNGELAPCMCVRPAVSHSPAECAGRLFVLVRKSHGHYRVQVSGPRWDPT